MLRNLFSRSPEHIDGRLRLELGYRGIDRYAVNVKELPAYRFVDLYRAVERRIATVPGTRTFEAITDEDLNSILHGIRPEWVSRLISKSNRTAWPVAASQETFLPTDQYWVLTDGPTRQPVVIRLRYRHHDERSVLEVAARDAAAASRIISELIEESLHISIYRNQMLSIALESGTKDEYGDIDKSEKLRISFKVAQPVPREEFVIDELVFGTLWRNVVDLHQRRDLLRRHGVPIRRGVLLYGPPGTGKTYACRYICGELANTTRIVVAGTALGHVTQVFEVARTYQPSVVILEDVDLVFSARDINLYSSALGDLLDQMDGLRPFEDVSIILTTNSIDRMEAAIRDRPGRISQCIYFGPPEDSLRAKYLAQYTRGYDCGAVDHARLVTMSRGTTPAFIKEWVHRSVQIATERIDPAQNGLRLETGDFEAALIEMRRFTDDRSGRIIGFIPAS